MARLPKYMKTELKNNGIVEITIKKWGLPLLLYQTLKENYELTFLQWLIFYPYMCFKVITK